MGIHDYLVFVTMPTTSSADSDIDHKIRLLCDIKANNSIEACSKVSMEYKIDKDRLRAVLMKKAHRIWSIETYTNHYVTFKRLNP
tara:strand:+ start:5072 stop:5326 length:255 start_codon:yes stop_codon:yes gene_type:complete